MTPTPRTIQSLFSAYYALMSTYRAEIFLWALATSLPLIMMGVWVQAGASGAFAGFTSVDAARYFIGVFIFRQLTICWVIYEFEYNVVSGRLSALLLQPLNPIWRYILMHGGEQACRLPFSVIFIGLSLFIFPDALWGSGEQGVWLPSWWRIGLAIACGYLAFLLRFFIAYTISMLAFWVERVSALEGINYLPYLFLSGLVVPIQTLPAGLQDAILWTPYPYVLWFPAMLVAAPPEAMPPDMIARGIATIAAWLIVFSLLQRVLWNRGLKHYSAMGA
ncbi:MAG: ABC transporter permease [Phycisphaeraceae bacterium]